MKILISADDLADRFRLLSVGENHLHGQVQYVVVVLIRRVGPFVSCRGPDFDDDGIDVSLLRDDVLTRFDEIVFSHVIPDDGILRITVDIETVELKRLAFGRSFHALDDKLLGQGFLDRLKGEFHDGDRTVIRERNGRLILPSVPALVFQKDLDLIGSRPCIILDEVNIEDERVGLLAHKCFVRSHEAAFRLVIPAGGRV